MKITRCVRGVHAGRLECDLLTSSSFSKCCHFRFQCNYSLTGQSVPSTVSSKQTTPYRLGLPVLVATSRIMGAWNTLVLWKAVEKDVCICTNKMNVHASILSNRGHTFFNNYTEHWQQVCCIYEFDKWGLKHLLLWLHTEVWLVCRRTHQAKFKQMYVGSTTKYCLHISWSLQLY